MTGTFPVRLGRVEAGSTLSLDLGRPWHWAVQGGTRSGKSVLLYRLLAGVAGWPAVVVGGLDPSQLLLAPWRNTSHPEWRAMGAVDLTSSVTALESVVAEMDCRITNLVAAEADQLNDFTPEQPLILFVCEEFPGLLAAAEAQDQAEGRKVGDRLAPRLQRGLGRLIREGAKVGIRVLLVAQRADAAIIGGSERSNLAVRVTMKVDNLDAVAMLHPTANQEHVAIMRNFAPGVGWVETPELAMTRFRTEHIAYSVYVNAIKECQG